MNNADFEKVATRLALCAVTRDTTELGHIKQAAGFDLNSIGQYLNTPGGRYALGGLGGAGLGALVGAMQPKRKGRNSLYYGALGGLGGLGLAHVYNSAGGTPAPAMTTETPTPGTDNANTTPSAAAVSTFLDDVSKPTAAGTQAPELTGQLIHDIPTQAAHHAQQLPGMEGISPIAQAGGGAVGLVAAQRYVAPQIHRRAASIAQRLNEAHNRSLATANAARDAQPRISYQNRLQALQNRPGLNTRTYSRAVRGLKADMNAELARARVENAALLERAATSNARRARTARGLAGVVNAILTAGGAYAGATAANTVPAGYEALNNQYNAAIK